MNSSYWNLKMQCARTQHSQTWYIHIDIYIICDHRNGLPWFVSIIVTWTSNVTCVLTSVVSIWYSAIDQKELELIYHSANFMVKVPVHVCMLAILVNVFSYWIKSRYGKYVTFTVCCGHIANYAYKYQTGTDNKNADNNKVLFSRLEHVACYTHTPMHACTHRIVTVL